MVRRDALLAQALGEHVREALREPARVHEDERRLVRRDVLGDAVHHLEALVAADKIGDAHLRQWLREAQTAERSARDYAALAVEEKERRDRLGGLKVRTYLKARTMVFTTVLPGMALAAEKAGARR